MAKRTVVYLNENFTKNFTISGLAKEVFSAPFHLCRVFRRETGLTLHAYVSRLRLTTALTRLKETDVLLKELALDLGYSSQSHFSSSLVKAIQGWKEAVFSLRSCYSSNRKIRRMKRCVPSLGVDRHRCLIRNSSRR